VADFEPDSPCARLVMPAPNHDAREGCERADILLLHYTGMESTDLALARLCERASQVSTHYLVRESGEILQLVPEVRRAWHAGVSTWERSPDINSRSIGIEIANPGHDFGYPDFPEPQLDALIDLCRDVVSRLAIRKDRVLAHSDVAPSRKSDPGEKFPWGRLHAAGVGHWVEPIPIVAGPSLAAGASGAAVEALQSALADYGYGIEVTGTYDAATTAVVTAFQRHFRPQLVDGIGDRSTVQTLQALLASRPV
jgi:N-acetylmuramoyl-L-alanine amidase